ncbi:MAG: hypothetical protein K2J80_03395 [Oscillospiraceae bacterium]|nr:hypothetical protein [Oscillospiraceae bacterium]
MRKEFAVTLLILGGAAAIFGLSFANLLLVLVLLHAGILIAIVVTGGAVFGIDRLRVLFRNKYGFSAPKFFLCAYAPSVAVSAVYYAVICTLDNAGYFKGFMAGLGEYLMGLVWLITSAAAIVLAAIMLVISAVAVRKKGE